MKKSPFGFNQSLIKYFNDNNFNIIKLTYLDIKSDIRDGAFDNFYQDVLKKFITTNYPTISK